MCIYKTDMNMNKIIFQIAKTKNKIIYNHNHNNNKQLVIEDFKNVQF